MELESHPGCHVWNPSLGPGATASWSAECAGGLASGTGTLKWVWASGESTSTGAPLQDGKPHGQWVVRFADGRVAEGPYVDGYRHGQWVGRTSDGEVVRITYEGGLPVDIEFD